MKKVLYLLTTTLFLTACQGQESNSTMGNADNTSFPVQKTEQEWKAQLSSEEYYVIRQKGTERPYTGEYNMHFDRRYLHVPWLRRPTLYFRFKI
jgi:peptide-methionine (R)-S-oxide reductase